jgi:hypothetical protein
MADDGRRAGRADPRAGIPRDCCVCGEPRGLTWVVYRGVSRIVGHESGDWMCQCHAAAYRDRSLRENGP